VERNGRGLVKLLSRICLEGLKETRKNLSLSPGRHLKPERPEYEVQVLTTRSRRSVA